MAKKENIIAALDLGTTKSCCMIAVSNNDELELIGIGIHPSNGGMRKGVIIDIEKTVKAIKCAVEDAEMMSGREVESVYVGISGRHIQSLNSEGKIDLKNKEVTQIDIDKVIEEAKNSAQIPFDREVIHIFPQEFIVDEQDGIINPLGMTGNHLEIKVYIITAAVNALQNIEKCVDKADLKIKNIVLEQLASSEAVLFSGEKELGTALIDIGGGTADLAIFFNNCLKYTAVFNIGGTQVTNDIAVGLITPPAEAEKIKKKHGSVLISLAKNNEKLEISSIGERQVRIISRQFLTKIIQARIKELLNLIKTDIAINGFGDLIPSGVVLTGGTSIIQGIQELGEHIFELPVRCAIPKKINGLTDKIYNEDCPIYSTAIGLLLYGLKDEKGQTSFNYMPKTILGKLKSWFRELFY